MRENNLSYLLIPSQILPVTEILYQRFQPSPLNQARDLKYPVNIQHDTWRYENAKYCTCFASIN